MQALQKIALEKSGVSSEESVEIDKLNLYDRLGPSTIRSISEGFYDRVYAQNGWFREIFANVEKETAMNNQYLFLVERFGGPRLYTAKKGYAALIGRHGPYRVDDKSAKLWLQCMEESLESIETIEPDTKDIIMKYFNHMAYYISAGKSLVNGSRLVGYAQRPGGYHQGGA